MFAKHEIKIVHTDFNKAFEQDRLFVRQDERLKIYVEKIGMLVTKSGRLLAHDPCALLYIEDHFSFSKTVAAGQYPVFASIACPVDNPNEGVICAAMVKFSDEPILKWELALRPGESMDELQGDDMVPFAHSVDAGFSCFVDFGAIKHLSGSDREELFPEKIRPVLQKSRAAEYAAVPINDQGENIVVFKSGFGDGGYSDYWGYTKDGHLAALTSDFFILVEEIKTTVRVPAKALKTGRSIKDRQLDKYKLKVKVTTLTEKEISFECEGPWSSTIDLQVMDDIGNTVTRANTSSSWADTSTYNCDLADPLPEKATLVLTFVVGERALG
jgi:hypothetical protein